MMGKGSKPWFGWLVLIVGVLYLWADFSAQWDFFGISGWTAFFVLLDSGL